MHSSLRLSLPVLSLVFAGVFAGSAFAADAPAAAPAAASPAATPASSATAAMPGLKVGEKAAAFTLKNASGEEVALADLLKKGNVALVFYRSGDWCPFCIAQIKDLQANLKDIQASGVQLVGISYDSPETIKTFTAKHGLTFVLLSDTGSKTIDAYGIRNQTATGRAVGVPHPAIFIVDQQGVIRAKLMLDGYRNRPPVADIITAAKSVK